MFQDLRYAVRTLLRAPSFTISAALTLAVGIAVNTLAFTLLNSLALRPMPVADADRVVRIFPVDEKGERQNLFSYPDYLDYRAAAVGFDGLAGYIPLSVTAKTAGLGDDAEDVLGYAVSANYFPLLGIAPSLGRAFLPREENAGDASAVAVISHSMWRRRFAGDPAVVGTSIVLNDRTFIIVGVGPERFMGTEPLAPDIWVPIGMQAVVAPGADLLTDRTSHWLLIAGRLHPGVSRDGARAALSVIADRLRRAYPAPSRPAAVVVARGTFFTIDPGLAPIIFLVLAIVGLVLAIACANVANLVLARTASRQRELAVRLAIGATRWRLVRQLVAESVVVGLIGGAAGLLLSVWTLRFLYPLGLSLVPSQWGTVVLDLTPDARVFAYTSTLALVAGAVLGLLPAWQASTPRIAGALHQDGTMIGGRVTRSRARRGLVVVQIAVCLVLLVGAGLLARGLQRARSLDLGFATAGVVFTDYDLRRHGYGVERAADYNRALSDVARGLPGVTSVALTSHVPLHGGVTRRSVRPEGLDEQVWCTTTSVSPEYFRALAIPLTAGRLFTPDESAHGAPMVVISEGLAARFWPRQDPLGRRISIAASLLPLTVVGMVRDTSSASLWRDKEMSIYLPAASADARDLHVLVRGAAAEPGAVTAALRQRARTLDTRVRFSATPLDTLLQLWILPSRVAAIAAAVLGLVALLLASVGIYGVVAYTVSHRTREIGIRMALGARGRDVRRMILRDGGRLIAVGVACGLVGAIAAGLLLSRFLFDVGPLDPLTFIAVPAVLCLVALAACYLPARRASRVEPLAALRTE